MGKEEEEPDEYLAGYPTKITQKLRKMKHYKLLFAKLIIQMQKRGRVELVISDDDADK